MADKCVLQGIQEPIRFVLEAKAKIYPSAERFWIIGRRNHLTQQFALTLKRVSMMLYSLFIMYYYTVNECIELSLSYSLMESYPY